MNIPNTIKQTLKVRNMRSTRTNCKVANQFIIDTNEGQYFQSYETIIAYYENKTGIYYLDEDSWNYSRTTSKYRSIFLNEDTKTTKERIENGTHKLVNLN